MYHTHILIHAHISLNRKFLLSCVCVYVFSERTWTQTLPWVLTSPFSFCHQQPDFLKVLSTTRGNSYILIDTGCWSSILVVKGSGFQPREYNEIHIKIYLPNENPGVMHKWFSDNKMQIKTITRRTIIFIKRIV